MFLLIWPLFLPVILAATKLHILPASNHNSNSELYSYAVSYVLAMNSPAEFIVCGNEHFLRDEMANHLALLQLIVPVTLVNADGYQIFEL